MYKDDLALKTDNGWYTIKQNQTERFKTNAENVPTDFKTKRYK